MDKAQKVYQVATGSIGKAYYSGNGTEGTYDSDLRFKPSSGDVIDVVVSSTDYCIRGYNVKGNINSLANAYTRGSSSTACTDIPPSTEAEDDDPDGGGGEGGGSITSGWKQIVAGGYQTCGIAYNDNAYCWGANWDGELGNNDLDGYEQYIPVPIYTGGVLSGKTIKSISVGDQHTCAIASDNQAYCWGYNSDGQLGNNDLNGDESYEPVAVYTSGVLSGKTIKSISSGYNQTCVIASDDQVYCWGEGEDGELGNNAAIESYEPVAVDTSVVLSGKTVKSISAGWYHSCAVTSDNQAYCWGANGTGALGNNSDVDSLVPVAVDTSGVLSGKTIESISAGGNTTCAIASDNQAYCWGDNYDGVLGNNSLVDSLVPVAVDTSGVLSGKTVKSISVWDSLACAIASDNLAYCWGTGGNGQLGNNSDVESLVPVAVDTSGVLNGKTIKSIDTGYSRSCAIASDNEAYCWGWNWYGELGDNTSDDSLVPVLVVFGNMWIDISAGYEHNCGIAADKKAYCWGADYDGELGDNTTEYEAVLSPVAVDTSGVLNGKTINSISTSYASSCAIAFDDQAYCWGLGTWGELGQGSWDDSNIPVAVDTSGVLSGKYIGSISSDPEADFTCVVAIGGTAYCWGFGGAGSLGNNSTNDSNVAVAVNTSGVLSGKTVKEISVGYENACVIASDNKAYCWGYNDHGALGNNSTVESHVPVAVDMTGALSGKTIKSISVGNETACVIASDNLAYCWGYGTDGELGNNASAHSSVPVAVDTSGVLSGKTIKSISVGLEHVCAIASDNKAYCWGENGYGKLGNGTTDDSDVPTAVDMSGTLSGKTIRKISAGAGHTCAIASDNKMYCWGYNYNGQLGIGVSDYDNHPSPVVVNPLP